MITVPPASRALANVARVRRSPVETSWCSAKRRVRPRLPIVEQRRLDLRHAGAIRIRFGRHVLSGVTRGLDRREKRVDLGVRGRIDVDDVQRGVRGGGRGDRFLQALEPAAHVDVRRDAALGRDAEHALDFRHRRAWCVRAAESHGDRALSQPFAQNRLHRRHLRVGGRPTAADPGWQQSRAGIAQHFHPRRNVSD